MATRPVFVARNKIPCVDVYYPEFSWNGGFAVSQSQKNIVGLHAAFAEKRPECKVLEISSKSLQPLGVSLSAFNLKKYVPSLGRKIPVECAFQGGKVFLNGGPYTDLYEKTPKEAKRDERLKTSGMLCKFFFDGKEFPAVPKTAFYDWLYVNALLENPELSKQLMEYDAFTDIVFNPEKSVNCQARAAAVFVALSRLGLIEACREFENFVRIAY